MKIKKIALQHTLLAAALALPLAAMAQAGPADAAGAPGVDGPAAAAGFGPGGREAQGERGRFGAPGLAGRGGRHEPREGGPDGRPGIGGDEHPGGPGGPGFGFGPPPFLHGFKLSEEQQDKVFAIVHGQAPYQREQQQKLRKAQQALQQLAAADKYDDAKAAALAKEVAQAVSNLELAHVRTEQKLRAVLTAEQRKALAERRATLAPAGPRF